MDVVILGAGGHGRDLAAVCEAAGVEVVETVDDERRGYRPILTAWSQPRRVGYLIGINDPAERRRFDHEQRIAPVVVHPWAHIGPRCELAPGVVVAAMACLSNDVELGRHVHINSGATLVRTRVGAYTTVAPGVHIGGDVEIGEAVFIGIGARVTNLVSIGDGAVIGAGAVVLESVPAGATVVGAPARALEAVT